MYYLNSRYYSPELGRFISADSSDTLIAEPMSLTDKNLYAYCDNNPIVRKDTGGEFWNTVLGALAGGLIEMAMRGENESAGQAFLRGSVTGAIAGFALDMSIATAGIAPALAFAAGGGAISSMLNTGWKNTNEGKETTLKEFVVSGTAGAIVNTPFAAAGRVAGRAVGTTVKSISKAVLKNSVSQVTTKSGRFLANKAGRNVALGISSSSGSSFMVWLHDKVIGKLFK